MFLFDVVVNMCIHLFDNCLIYTSIKILCFILSFSGVNQNENITKQNIFKNINLTLYVKNVRGFKINLKKMRQTYKIIHFQ